MSEEINVGWSGKGVVFPVGGEANHVVCPFINKIREFGEVGGLTGGVADDDNVEFMFGGDTMGFASHPGFTRWCTVLCGAWSQCSGPRGGV